MTTRRRPAFPLAALTAFGFAAVWWGVGLWFRAGTGVPVWADQYTTFTQALPYLADPYPALAFPYAPWTALLLAPFGLPPFEIAVLLQMALYFVLVAAVVYRFGGGMRALLLALTSAIALDTALEINIDWIVCAGLLLPRPLSGPLLLVKPQVAFGYGFSFTRREIALAGAVTAAVIALSLLLWPGWPGAMLAEVQANTLGDWGARINLAPSALIPAPLAWAVGLALAWRAFRRKDAITGVWGGVFLAPYLTLYSLLPAYALLAARRPLWAGVIGLALWLLYGGVLLPFVLGA